MPHISFKIKAESISTFGTNGLTKSLFQLKTGNVKKNMLTDSILNDAYKFGENILYFAYFDYF